MGSKADKAYISKLFEEVIAYGPIETVEQYRDFVPRLLEQPKNRDPLPVVGAYEPEVRINDNFTASIAVPKTKGSGPFPVMLLCHGHGALAGSPHSYRRHSLDMAAAGYLTITPDYRKAPEHKHPAGLDDLLATALWIKDNAARYGGDGSAIVISGDSVGATLAAVTLLRVLETPGAPAVTAFVGLEGFYERTNEMMPFVLDAYLPDGYTADDVAHPWVSPTHGFKEGQTYPPILLITGSADFAAPSTLRFSLSLMQKNISHQLHVLEDMPHDFMKMVDLDGYREGQQLMFDWLRRHHQ